MLCQCTLNFLGYSALAYVAYRVLLAIYNVAYPYFLASPIDLHKAAGAKWAAVTGATDGIGKAYALQLAKKKFNILLISRTQSKLDETKAELEKEAPGVEVRTYSFDFSTGDRKAYEPLYNELNKLEIGILVNNVGMSFEFPEVMHLSEGGIPRLADMTIINTLPPVLLSAAVLPQMVARKAGVIINISSAAAYNVMSHWNVYSAAKRFVLHLSQILRLEYEPLGITVQTICPMLVATKMAKIRRASFFGPFPEQFVKAAIRTIGIVSNTTGFFSHQLQVELMGLLPEWLVQNIVLSQTLGIRAAAIKKRAKAQ